MPRLNGFEATRQIRARSGGWQLPIVAVTADVMEDAQRACEEAGMDDFVTKPVCAAGLEEVLRRWCGSSKLGQQRATASRDHQEDQAMSGAA